MSVSEEPIGGLATLRACLVDCIEQIDSGREVLNCKLQSWPYFDRETTGYQRLEITIDWGPRL